MKWIATWHSGRSKFLPCSRFFYYFLGSQLKCHVSSGDSTQLIYLRARYYNPADGRFQSRDTWGGDANRPMSMNRWMYVEGNPVNQTDPSGHSPISSSQVFNSALSQHHGSLSNISVLAYLINCSPSSSSQYPNFDLTGYLALAMTKHGRDGRVKAINYTLTLAEMYQEVNDIAGTALWLTGYLAFNGLEGGEKEWDIKVGIQNKLRQTKGVILCGLGFNCKWVDYSVPGNIHFGYVAYLAKIDHFVAAVAGGLLEQKDLYDQNLPLEPLYCFQNAFPGHCDNPQDQAAVDFGYMLGIKYGKGITDEQLRRELNTYALWSFQKPPLSFPIPYRAQPQPNFYGADYFNN